MQNRAAQFASLLNSDTLDSYQLKHACLQGIPDDFSDLRAQAWRCLLGVIDLSVASAGQRKASLAKRRKQYADLVEELLGQVKKRETDSARAREDVYLDEIDKDIRRTQTTLAFFSQHATPSSLQSIRDRRTLIARLDHLRPTRRQEVSERYTLPSGSDNVSNGKGKERGGETEEVEEDRHYECLIRLLYVFALLNPVHYVQGMSELVAPLYYVFAHSKEVEDIAQAEADTFWAFSTLMGEIGEFYVQDSDGVLGDPVRNDPSHANGNGGDDSDDDDDTPLAMRKTGHSRGGSRTGLGATIRRFSQELHWLDSELAYSLHRRKEIQPTFYALRWITTLFALEIRIPDLVRIWDSLFALLADRTSSTAKATGSESPARDFLLDICCAMVLQKRGELLPADFATCLSILQNYMCDDVQVMLALAFSIREKRITQAITGLDFSTYASAPNTPILGPGESPDHFGSSISRKGDALPPLPETGLQSVKQRFSLVAGSAVSSQTAQALKSRFWSTKKAQETDFPDDISETSAATAPAILGGSFSPTRLAASLSSSLTGQPSSPLRDATPNSSPAPASPKGASTFPSSASTLFNRYASSFSQSDAAAALSKATTNSYIAAMAWKEAAPSTYSKLRSDVAAQLNGAKTVIRPPSPNLDPPFTPPTGHSSSHFSGNGLLSPDSPGLRNAQPSPPGSEGGRRGSAGPKPLLLSSAARRASATNGPGPETSPSMSRRTSYSSPGNSLLGLGLPSSFGSSTSDSTHASSSPSQPRSASAARPYFTVPASHTRAVSASHAGGGSYKVGPAARNGHVEHARAGSFASSSAATSAMRSSLSSESQAPNQSQTTDGARIGEITSVDGKTDAGDPSETGEDAKSKTGLPSLANYDFKKAMRGQESPFALPRTKAASTEVEMLGDGSQGSLTPGDIMTHYFNPSEGNSRATTPLPPDMPLPSLSEAHQEIPAPAPAPQSPIKTERFSLSDDMPLGSSSSTLSRGRRQPRTTSLASVDSVQSGTAALDLDTAVPPEESMGGSLTRSKRKLASSRRTRKDSIGSQGTAPDEYSIPPYPSSAQNSVEVQEGI